MNSTKKFVYPDLFRRHRRERREKIHPRFHLGFQCRHLDFRHLRPFIWKIEIDYFEKSQISLKLFLPCVIYHFGHRSEKELMSIASRNFNSFELVTLYSQRIYLLTHLSPGIVSLVRL